MKTKKLQKYGLTFQCNLAYVLLNDIEFLNEFLDSYSILDFEDPYIIKVLSVFIKNTKNYGIKIDSVVLYVLIIKEYEKNALEQKYVCKTLEKIMECNNDITLSKHNFKKVLYI